MKIAEDILENNLGIYSIKDPPISYAKQAILLAMKQYANLTAPKWVSVGEQLPADNDDRWKQVLIDGKHHILPHCEMHGQ